MSNRVGAPLGGRVHWLLLNLSGKFKTKYDVSYNYKTHCYTFYRYVGMSRKICDTFIVIRTSKRCFKLMYTNLTLDVYIYKSFRTSKQCAVFMDKVYDLFAYTAKIYK